MSPYQIITFPAQKQLRLRAMPHKLPRSIALLQTDITNLERMLIRLTDEQTGLPDNCSIHFLVLEEQKNRVEAEILLAKEELNSTSVGGGNE
jgi:hypothetical protein